MKNSKVTFYFLTVLIAGLFLFSACSNEVGLEEEFLNSDLVDSNWAEDGIGEVIQLSSAFLVDVDDIANDEKYDYIIGHEEFYFNKVFLQTRWNNLVEEINMSFGWGTEAYEYIQDNYDELKIRLEEQLRSEIMVTLLAQKLGFEADEIELKEILGNMEEYIFESEEDGVDVESIFVEMFGTTKYTWEIQLERQLASIAMIDSLWETNPLSEAMLEQLKEDVSDEDLPHLANVYHILVDTEDEAQIIYEKMKSGIHPRDLHDEFSQDSGGPHYIFPRGMMVEPFEEWAFSAEAGDIGIVPTQFGFHVTLSYGKELDTEELEHLARLHYLDKHIIDLITDMGVRWASQPDIVWVPQQ